MAREPFKATGSAKTDEEIAAEAMRDIYGNVTAARGNWAEYDMRYVIQRILRAITEAKGAAVLLFVLTPLAVHAQDHTYKGVIVHPEVVTLCIGAEVHNAPCTRSDIGYIGEQGLIHFTKQLTPSELCATLNRLVQGGYIQQ